MNEYSVKPAEIARKAALSNPNVIYNFLNGRSGSLSYETLVAIADAYPDVTIDRLSGRMTSVRERAKPRHRSGAAKSASDPEEIIGRLFVMLEVVTGDWRRTLEFTEKETFNLPMPIPSDLHFAGAFGAILRAPGAELLFPNGSVLVCLSPKSGVAALTDGAIVILECANEGKKQLSIRQIERRGSDAWLCCRSTHILHQQPVSMPRLDNIDGAWSVGGPEKYSLYAVVVGAYSQFFSKAA